MADEINLAGKIYISSKRAAKQGGYSQDYVGQLARSGKIDARRVGGQWFVDFDSIDSHKKGSAEYSPKQPESLNREEPKALVAFDGKEHISASRASELTGYNQDYIGQLARSGKIMSRQVGSRWYVDYESLMRHKREKDALLAGVQVESVGLQKKTVATPTPSKAEDLMRYEVESTNLMPDIKVRAPVEEPSPVSKPTDATEAREEIVVPINVLRPAVAQVPRVSDVGAELTGRVPDISIYKANKSSRASNLFAPLLLVFITAMVGMLLYMAASVSRDPSTSVRWSSYEAGIEYLESLVSTELIYVRDR